MMLRRKNKFNLPFPVVSGKSEVSARKQNIFFNYFGQFTVPVRFGTIFTPIKEKTHFENSKQRQATR